jgi:hypothetical protein
MIGLRHQVGGDWYNYLGNFEDISSMSLGYAISEYHGDPSDTVLNWIGSQSGLGIYLVNTVYAFLFTIGLLVFCRRSPRPWLALTVSVPYLITVVAMGYTRQGGAIGLALLGFVALEDKKVARFIFWIALAATFHKSAVILVPLAMMADSKRRILTFFWVAISAVVLFGLLLQEYADALFLHYVGAEYQSSGATVRILMNALPAALFLFRRERFHLNPAQLKFWTWMAWGALAFVLLLYVSPSSTAVDRVALYWIPIQLFVWSRIPDAMGHTGSANSGWVWMVVGYSAVVHFTWLHFADNSNAWLPYQFYPWVWLWE